MKPTTVKKHIPFYILHTAYAITIMPSDKYQFLGKPARYIKFRSFIHEYFLGLPFDYSLTIEISEPRGMKLKGFAGPRLHLHGTFTFNTNKALASFLCDSYYFICRIGNMDIDSINSPETWYKYCHKGKLFKNPTISNGSLLPPTLSSK